MVREIEYRAAESRSRELTDTIQDVFWVTASDQKRLIYVSPAYQAVFGRPTAELVATPEVWLEAVHPDDRPRVTASIPEQANGPFEQEFRIVRPGGEVRWVQTRSFPVRDAGGRTIRIIGITRDVTARCESDQQLVQRKAELQLALEAARLAAWTCDVTTGALRWSADAPTVLGVPADDLGEHADDFFALLAPGDVDRVRRVTIDGSGGTPTYEVEFRVPGAAGGPRRIAATGRLIRDGRGTLMSLGVIQDVTARRAAEDQLQRKTALLAAIRRAHARYLERHGERQAFDEILEALLRLTGSRYGVVAEVEPGPDGRDRMVPGLATIGSWDTEAQAYDHREVLGPGLAVMESLLERVLTTGERTLMASLPPPAGLLGNFAGFPIRLAGVLVGVVGLANREGGYQADLSDELAPLLVTAAQLIDARRTEAERSRAAADRAMFFSLVENSADFVGMTGLDGRVLYVNPAGRRLIGLPPDAPLEQVDVAQFFTPESARQLEAEVLPAVQATGRWHGEVTVRQAGTGELVPVHASRFLVQNPGPDESFCIATTMRDVRAQKEHERELVEAKEAAEAGTRAKSEFLATMSHEIRTPMNGVLGFARLLAETALDGEQADYVERLQRSGAGLLQIINEVLDFSKIEAGRLEVSAEPFAVMPLVEETVGLLAREGEAQGLRLGVRGGAGCRGLVVADPGRVRQVLLNLVGNALKFTERGSVVVGVDDAGDREVMIRVTDTGIGIPVEKQSLLFAEFSQVDASTSRRHGGTGLGLAISRRLVEAMNGRIGMTSEPGLGSCFWFTLPRDLEPVEAIPKRRPGAALRAELLLVTDDEFARTELSGQIQAWRLPYRHVPSLAAAAEVLRGPPPAEGRVVLVDSNLPDALRLGRGIADEVGPHQPLILIGRRSGAPSDQELRDAGFSGRVPDALIRPSDLLDTIMLVRRAASGGGAEAAAGAVAVRRPADRPQLQVLVVEDNAVNQLLARRMLERLGCAVAVANDGEQAVAVVQEGEFDLVFMDCQMPVVDGYQATGMIRAWEEGRLSPGDRPLPIIALTANALRGDRERCLAAGMSDYLAKPVVPEELADMVERWAPGAVSTDAPDHLN